MYPEDGLFQEIVGEVQSPVTYLPQESIKASSWWKYIDEANEIFPNLFKTLEFFRKEKFRHIHQAIELAKIIKSKRIKHLHSHFATSATTVARIASYLANVSFTFTAHAKDIYHQETDFQDLQNKIHDASSVITVSDYNVKYLTKLFNTDSNKIERIYNGMDINRLKYSRPNNRKSNIITISRLVEKKGLDILVDACNILSKRGINFHCTIIGKGELESKLADQINDNNLQDTVDLSGPLPRTQVIKKFQSASVFAAPAIVAKDGNRDGLPTSILEAMALGIPCVSTDVTGIPEVIKNNETGLLIPQNNSEELANAIEKLLSDSKLSELISKNARNLIESDFDIDKNSTRIRKIFATKIPSKELLVTGEIA